MDHIGIEESYLTYHKFLDGVGIPVSTTTDTGCDLSFNDGITAGYLLTERKFSSVYLPSWGDTYISGLKPFNMSLGLSHGLRNVRCDYLISVGGTFNFMPIDDVACGIYNALNRNGKFLFGVFPQLFDDNGTDLLHRYSIASGLNVNKKLSRWFTTLNVSFSRYFPETEISTLIADTSANEIRDFFRANSIYSFLCRTDEEFDAFFGKLNDTSRLYMFWQVLSGEKK